MKIAFIGQKGIPAISGGVEKHVEKLAARLAANGHEVFVYTRSHYTDPRLKVFRRVRLISLPSLRTKHLDAITHTFLATIHSLFQPYDIIHYHSIGPSVLAILPRIFKPGTRVVATFHTRDYLHKKWNALARCCLRLSERLMCLIPEKTIVISETLQAYAKSVYGREFTLIPNGSEVEFEPETQPLALFGLRPKRYILSVSRLVEHKGIHYLIKAFQDLEREGKLPNNFKLVIVGADAHTPEYEKYLKVLSAGHPRILFLGERHGWELSALFSHAALFVQPSEEEGLSIALLEAMGYGLLPIVSDIPANLEAIKNGCGVSFQSKNIEALKKELAYYINRPEEVVQIGTRARIRAEDEYGWDAIAKKTADLYIELLKQKGARAPYAEYRLK